MTTVVVLTIQWTGDDNTPEETTFKAHGGYLPLVGETLLWTYKNELLEGHVYDRKFAVSDSLLPVNVDIEHQVILRMISVVVK